MKKVFRYLTVFIFTLFVGVCVVNAKNIEFKNTSYDEDGNVCHYSDNSGENMYEFWIGDSEVKYKNKKTTTPVINTTSKELMNQMNDMYKCYKVIYVVDNGKVDYKNPQFSLESNAGLEYQKMCYMYSSYSKGKYKWTTQDEIKKLSDATEWIQFTNIYTENQCAELANKYFEDGKDPYSKSENSGACYICNPKSLSPQPIWAKQGEDYKKYLPCTDYQFDTSSTKTECMNSAFKYQNSNGESTVSCGNGNGTLKNIPKRLVKIINTIVTVIQIAVPVLLIILGMVDFAKAAMAQKEDEIKKGQKIFISRLITGIMIFFVIFIVKIGVRFVNDKTESDTVLSCVDCFISGKC